MSVGVRDLRRLLGVVAEINEAPDGAFLRTALKGAYGLVGCETVSYNEQDAKRRTQRGFRIEPKIVEPASMTGYAQHLGQHPTFEAWSSGRLTQGTSVAVSDLLGAREFRALPLYAEYYRHRRVEDQLVTHVVSRREHAVSLVFSRSRRGFSERDRAVTELLAPHIRHALAHRQRLLRLSTMTPSAALSLDGLTGREREIVELLGTGAADHRIATVLRISRRTVGKHLENAYRKLGVRSRSELLARLRPAEPEPSLLAAG